MKRTHRINRITQRKPKPKNRIIPILAVFAALGLLLQVVLVGTVVGVVGAGTSSYYTTVSKEGIARLKQTSVLENVRPTTILDRNGKVLLQISDPNVGLQNVVPLSRIPQIMRWALIDTEDKTFYTNPGVEPSALLRAVRDNLSGRPTGGSTLTQQMVKNLVLDRSQTAQRKIQEIAIAVAVSQKGSGFSKNKVLYLYLNSVFFGHHAVGVDAAAQIYFGKHVWRLDLGESALLAGLVQKPTGLDPLGAYGSAAALARLHDVVLPRMVAQGHITRAQSRAAYAEMSAYRFVEHYIAPTTTSSAAPYWTEWIKGLLGYQQTYYTDPHLAATVVKAGGFTSGLTIQTTLDLNLYRHTQDVMLKAVQQIAASNVNDAAVVTLDPHSGQCLAMVGGINYDGTATGSQINMAANPRSPGSSFKMFTYLTAFEHGWSPSTVLPDEPRSWPDSSSPTGFYSPTNYDLQWHGAVSVRTALANSFNMPAVETIDAVGPRNVLKTAIAMGARYLNGVKNPPLSMTLGSKEVPLWQMAIAYNTLANGGAYRPMSSILSIKDVMGKVVYRYHTPAAVQVVSAQDAYLVTSILKDNSARSIAFGSPSVLQLGPDAQLPVNVPAAAKTGTSQYFIDNLTIGYTPQLLTATWVGNPDHSPMLNVEGIDGAGPIWHNVMEWDLLHPSEPRQGVDVNQPATFPVPPGIFIARASATGYLASPYTQWTIVDLFAAGALPHQFDTLGPSVVPDAPSPITAPRLYGNAAYDLDGGSHDGYVSSIQPFSETVVATPTTPYAGVPPAAVQPGAASGSSGILTYNPGTNSNICGGGRYTYTTQFVNEKLQYAYTCQ